MPMRRPNPMAPYRHRKNSNVGKQHRKRYDGLQAAGSGWGAAQAAANSVDRPAGRPNSKSVGRSARFFFCFLQLLLHTAAALPVYPQVWGHVHRVRRPPALPAYRRVWCTCGSSIVFLSFFYWCSTDVRLIFYWFSIDVPSISYWSSMELIENQ